VAAFWPGVASQGPGLNESGLRGYHPHVPAIKGLQADVRNDGDGFDAKIGEGSYPTRLTGGPVDPYASGATGLADSLTPYNRLIQCEATHGGDNKSAC